MDQSSSPGGTRRKMRKSTQSCAECRRRKIRCIFPSGGISVCLPCSARGSQCVDQRCIDNAVDEKRTLRERVSRLESLLETVLKDRLSEEEVVRRPYTRSDSFSDSPQAQEEAESIMDSDHRAPLVSVLANTALLWAEDGETEDLGQESRDDLQVDSSISSNGLQTPSSMENSKQAIPRSGIERIGHIQSSTAKEKRICKALREALPPYDKMIQTFEENASWWDDMRRKTFGKSKPVETLPQYAARTYRGDNAPELGILVTAFGRSTNENPCQYFSVVDNLIISDDEYASAMDGMECIIILAKCYIDIGQPRKGWLTYRRGLALAQLINLHRNHSISPERESIWWTIYHGDRFISLLLGLPYGINDAHCDLSISSSSSDAGLHSQQFVLRCFVIAGQVIDRSQATKEPLLSHAMKLEEEMEIIAASMPQSWWDISSFTISRSHDAVREKDRLLPQVAFYHIRTYLHLPFMLKSHPSSRYEHSKMACIHSSREVLRRYHILRSEFNGQALLDCKTTDFLGFMASVILLIGLVHLGGTMPARRSQQDENDWHLLETSLAIFQRLSVDAGCNIASQCHRALDTLMRIRDDNSTGWPGNHDSKKILIPYFGTLSIKGSALLVDSSTGKFGPTNATATPDSSLQSLSNGAALSTQTIQETGVPPKTVAAYGDANITYDGFYLSNSSTSGMQSGGESFRGLSNGGNTLDWTDMPMMDIDQDWTMFWEDMEQDQTL